MNLNLSTATRIGLNLLALLGVVVALWLGRSIFIPATIAVFLAALLWPLARLTHLRLGFPWAISCFTVIGLLLVVNFGVFFVFTLAVPKVLQDLPAPGDTHEQEKLYNKFRTQLEKVSPVPLDAEWLPPEADKSKVFLYVRDSLSGPNMTNLLLRLGGYAMDWLWQAVLILFILLFLLLEGEMLSRRVVEIFGPGGEPQRLAVDALTEMAKSIRAYLLWRTIVNIGLGFTLGLVYYAAGLRQPITWAILTALLCYVPYLGTIIAGIPPVLDAFIYSDSPWVAFGILVFYTAVVTFEGYIIVPVVMGSSMDLNATTVILTCLFWDLVWGTPGLFLAMPIMAGVKAVCLHVPGWEAWGNLMGTYRVTPPPDPATAKRIEEIASHLDVDTEGDKTIVMDERPPEDDEDEGDGRPRIR